MTCTYDIETQNVLKKSNIHAANRVSQPLLPQFRKLFVCRLTSQYKQTRTISLSVRAQTTTAVITLLHSFVSLILFRIAICLDVRILTLYLVLNLMFQLD